MHASNGALPVASNMAFEGSCANIPSPHYSVQPHTTASRGPVTALQPSISTVTLTRTYPESVDIERATLSTFAPPAHVMCLDRLRNDPLSYESLTATRPLSLLPPYTPHEEPSPAYTEVDIPHSNVWDSAKVAYKAGFRFPPCWVVGWLMLYVPARIVPQAICGVSEWQQQLDLEAGREEDEKWAKKCRFASVATIVAILGVLAIAFFIKWCLVHTGKN